jgi:hypothetical protein
MRWQNGLASSITPRALPWRRPRHELLLLALVAVAALSSVYIATAQDTSRLCLARSLEHASVHVGSCVGSNVDQAHYRGGVFSDKAPGMSVLALPAVAATRLPSAERWVFAGDLRVWAVRLLSGGIAFILLAFAVGRVAEGLAPGAGGFALVTFGLGTLAAPLAATTFDHVAAGALVFAAFVLCSRGWPALAGLAAGAAVLVEYQTGTVGILVAALALAHGRRAFLRYTVGTVPGLATVAAYDWIAFGSPLHLPYRYVANRYAADQASGFFGIGVPRAHAAYWILIGDRGLLLVSPVLVAALAGLALVWRRYPVEITFCAIVGVVFLLLNCGYFLPYGGTSPGPRFLIPALPFVAIGLAPALARWRRVTAALAVVSVFATSAVMLTWTILEDEGYRQTTWGEIARVPSERSHSRLVEDLSLNILHWAGFTRPASALVVIALALATLGLSLVPARQR